MGVVFKITFIKICALLEYYAAYSGKLPTFRGNTSMQSPRFKKSKKSVASYVSGPFKMNPIGFPETSIRKSHCVVRNIKECRISYLLRTVSLKSGTSVLRSDCCGICVVRKLRSGTARPVFRIW